MSFNLEVLKVKKPEIAKAIVEWREEFENQKFELSPLESYPFEEAISKLMTHLCNVSKSVTIRTVVGQDGITGVYLEVEPRKS